MSKANKQTFTPSNIVFRDGEDRVNEEKFSGIISAVNIFIAASDSMVSEVLMMFNSFPNNWQVFHEELAWDKLDEVTKIERTVNFVVALKDWERQSA